MSLPGTEAHFEMAPEMRIKEINELKIAERNPRNAAVLMLFYPKNDLTHLALILRPVYEGVHSGQIALPGGKVEELDENYEQTALRETYEEIGVPSSTIEMIKKMSKIYIPPSNFWVHPYLGFCEQRPEFVLQVEEVDKVIEVPVEELINAKNRVPKVLTTSYAKNIEVPSFQFNGHTVWGATAMMLNELKTSITQAIE